MAVNVSKLWGDAKFNNLTLTAKLLYLYLITNPSINYVGVVSLIPEISSHQIGMTMDEFKEASQELKDKNYIYIKKYNDVIYFIIPSHFSTIAKSEAVLEKIKSNLKALPVDLKNYLESIGISSSAKEINIEKPTIEEIRAFCIVSGYNINAKDFYDFYESYSTARGRTKYWVDSKGRIVRDWRQKLQRVWFKPDRKVNVPKDAPQGYEFFTVEVDGVQHYVDYWKDGKPFSKDFVVNKELKKEYDRRTKGS